MSRFRRPTVGFVFLQILCKTSHLPHDSAPLGGRRPRCHCCTFLVQLHLSFSLMEVCLLINVAHLQAQRIQDVLHLGSFLHCVLKHFGCVICQQGLRLNFLRVTLAGRERRSDKNDRRRRGLGMYGEKLFANCLKCLSGDLVGQLQWGPHFLMVIVKSSGRCFLLFA